MKPSMSSSISTMDRKAKRTRCAFAAEKNKNYLKKIIKRLF